MLLLLLLLLLHLLLLRLGERQLVVMCGAGVVLCSSGIGAMAVRGV